MYEIPETNEDWFMISDFIFINNEFYIRNIYLYNYFIIINNKIIINIILLNEKLYIN